ncbi:MAG TPA: alpha/beta hydrolase [Acidimicrobiales bacterium]|nr:alpha/beta hydrolase [Acidimicrobiales bacterium]
MHSATWLDIDGSQVYVEIAGVGKPVFCIHTAGQSGVQYRRVLQELPLHGYQVVVVDLPDHGRSLPAISGPIEDLHRYAEICWQVIQQLKLEDPIIVGCSVGGKITLDLCVHHGESITAGVAMEADSYNGSLSVSGLRRSMSDSASPSQGDRTYFGALASCGTSVPARVAEQIAVMHRREDSVVTSSDLIGWTTHDLRSDLHKVACPLLVVAGSEDFWVHVDRCAEVALLSPHAGFILLEGVGHYPMEELEDFPTILSGWLEDLTQGRLPSSQKQEFEGVTDR